MLSNLLGVLLRGVIKGALQGIALLMAFRAGGKKAKARQDAKDAEVLKAQRDNNVTSVSGADSYWVRARKRKRFRKR